MVICLILGWYAFSAQADQKLTFWLPNINKYLTSREYLQVKSFLSDETSNRACEPKDFQDVSSFFFNDDTPCLPACLTTDYIPSVTHGNIEVGAIKRYFQLVGGQDFGIPEYDAFSRLCG